MHKVPQQLSSPALFFFNHGPLALHTLADVDLLRANSYSCGANSSMSQSRTTMSTTRIHFRNADADLDNPDNTDGLTDDLFLRLSGSTGHLNERTAATRRSATRTSSISRPCGTAPTCCANDENRKTRPPLSGCRSLPLSNCYLYSAISRVCVERGACQCAFVTQPQKCVCLSFTLSAAGPLTQG
jgi:hypothetical protein